MTKSKNTHGGKRKRAGRKPAADPKKLISLYVEQSYITAHGGEEKLKENCYIFIRSKNN